MLVFRHIVFPAAVSNQYNLFYTSHFPKRGILPPRMTFRDGNVFTPFCPLLAFTAKCGVPANQWTWLCQVLLEVSMTTIALWICVCADDWAAELAVNASNAFYSQGVLPLPSTHGWSHDQGRVSLLGEICILRVCLGGFCLWGICIPRCGQHEGSMQCTRIHTVEFWDGPS